MKRILCWALTLMMLALPLAAFAEDTPVIPAFNVSNMTLKMGTTADDAVPMDLTGLSLSGFFGATENVLAGGLNVNVNDAAALTVNVLGMGDAMYLHLSSGETAMKNVIKSAFDMSAIPLSDLTAQADPMKTLTDGLNNLIASMNFVPGEAEEHTFSDGQALTVSTATADVPQEVLASLMKEVGAVTGETDASSLTASCKLYANETKDHTRIEITLTSAEEENPMVIGADMIVVDETTASIVADLSTQGTVMGTLSLEASEKDAASSLTVKLNAADGTMLTASYTGAQSDAATMGKFTAEMTVEGSYIAFSADVTTGTVEGDMAALTTPEDVFKGMTIVDSATMDEETSSAVDEDMMNVVSAAMTQLAQVPAIQMLMSSMSQSESAE